MAGRRRRPAAGNIIFSVVLVLASMAGVVFSTAPAALANSCSFQPNLYAAGTDNTGNRYGIQGNIKSYNDLNSSYQNMGFIDESEHVGLQSGKGLEVGWYEGWGNQTQAYATDAHAYATADGPREVDGPQITDTNSFYIAYWQGGGKEHYGVRKSGDHVIFEGTISTDGNNGPGTSVALGEVNYNGTTMQGFFSNLEHRYGLHGSWYDWPGMSTCADAGYTGVSPASNIFSDYGSGTSVPEVTSSLPAAKLPASARFVRLNGMTRIRSGRAPLWSGKDSSPYTAQKYGYTGSLYQGYILRSAVNRFGTLTSGSRLQLPLPLAFASRHPGPAEVFDVTRSFSNSWAPRRLLNDPNFADTDASGVIPVHSGTVHGGLAWKVVSKANGGMAEFRFEWARGHTLTGVSVVGARLTLAEARAVARKAGS